MESDQLSPLQQFYVAREIHYTLVRSPEDLAKADTRLIQYRFGGNGVFIEAKNEVFSVRKRLAPCLIKGLCPIEERFDLHIPRIPEIWLDRFIRCASFYAWQGDTPHECMVYIYYSEAARQFEIIEPYQQRSADRVVYDILPDRRDGYVKVIDAHSHGFHKPYLSSTDIKSSQGLGLYGVLGCLDKTPQLVLYVGIYGSLFPIAPDTVFDLSPARLISLTGSHQVRDRKKITYRFSDCAQRFDLPFERGRIV